MAKSLIAKYNVPGPRYTSYPTVPYWEQHSFNDARWRETVRRAYAESNASDGLSLYVHLPYCETPCTFCGCIKQFTRDHAVEEPYVDSVLREWALYLADFGERPRLREMHLGGGTPTFFSPRNLARLVDRITAQTVVTEPFEFGFEANPGSTTDEHLAAMHALGFRRLSLGIQDFDPVVQQTINRIQPFEVVARVTESARRLGYSSINFDLVYGLPRQQLAGIVGTVERVLSLRPDRIAFYGYAHVPWVKGIAQRRFCEAEIPRDAEKRALYEIGRDMLLEAGYHQIGMDHFALASDSLYRSVVGRTVHRNFMGYTPMHTRLGIGLGMSAISDSWYAFAQNEKSVEAYVARLSDGELPVCRGHLLDEEDLILRRHILELMCHFETSLTDDDGVHPAVRAGCDRLFELALDGLVTLDEERVRVTEKGRPFIRNVCMAFDARLWRSQPSARVFSEVI